MHSRLRLAVTLFRLLSLLEFMNVREREVCMIANEPEESPCNILEEVLALLPQTIQCREYSIHSVQEGISYLRDEC